MEEQVSNIYKLDDFERWAKERLSTPVWEFILGYPERGDTLKLGQYRGL